MIKVMIVDDSPQRYRDLLPKLDEIGIPRTSIKMLSAKYDAIEELKENQYDLLVLDILLPAWPDGEPDRQNALDLLFAVNHDEAIKKPHSIIGITADTKVADEVAPDFEEFTWTIASYSPTSDGWIGKIVNCVKYLQSKEKNKKPVVHNYDLAVICALANPELEEVLKLPWNWSAAMPLDDTIFYREGYFEKDNNNYRVVAAHSTRMGMVSSAILTTKIVEHLRPKCVAMTGICAGHKSKAQLGDVLIADPAWDYQSGKLTSVDGRAKMEFSPHQIPISALIRSRVEQISSDRSLVSDILSEFGSDAPRGFKIQLGPVASGGAVLADGKVIDEVTQFQNRDLLGIEMEIYGVYAAVQQSSAPQPQFVAIKGVCDYADPKKKDGAQRFASYASARVLQRLFETYAKDFFG